MQLQNLIIKIKKQASVNSLKCNNINVNVNGLEHNIFPPFLGGDEVAAEAVESNTDGNSFTNNNGDGSQINDFRFICINNNNNTVIAEPPISPEPTTGTLNVTKQITCVDQIEGDCEDLLEVINESRFPFQVEGNNPDPSSPFPGSPTGTDVTLGPGN